MNKNMAWVNALKRAPGGVRDFQDYLGGLILEAQHGLRGARNMEQVTAFQTQIILAERIDADIKEFLSGEQNAG